MNIGRNLVITIIAAVLVTALLLVIFLGEPARMQAETRAQRGESISRGALQYDAYCAGCHGERGEGLPGIYPPLNVEDLWTGREEIAFYGTLEDYVALNISAGHPGQRMPSWSQEFGGPLRDDQIADLTNYVLNWQGPQPPGTREQVAAPGPTEPEAEATPAAPMEPAGAGDPAKGEELFVKSCSSCHNPDAKGGSLGPTLVSADLAAQNDDFLRDTIINGRTGTAMPPWGSVLGAQDVEDVIAWLRQRQAEER